jgi:hypothetical protein
MVDIDFRVTTGRATTSRFERATELWMTRITAVTSSHSADSPRGERLSHAFSTPSPTSGARWEVVGETRRPSPATCGGQDTGGRVRAAARDVDDSSPRPAQYTACLSLGMDFWFEQPPDAATATLTGSNRPNPYRSNRAAKAPPRYLSVTLPPQVPQARLTRYRAPLPPQVPRARSTRYRRATFACHHRCHDTRST